MVRAKLPWVVAAILATLTGPVVQASGPAKAREDDPAGSLTPAKFADLLQIIRPGPGESRWLEVPWLLSIHEARQKAAAEGKPILVMAGGGAVALGGC